VDREIDVPGRRPTVRRRSMIVAVGGAVVGVALLLGLLALGGGGGPGPTPDRPPEIRQTFPNPGDLIIAQGEVGAVVPQSWSFQLTIDTTAVPDDQLEKVEQLGQFKFKPRPGRVIEHLGGGPHTATVVTSSLDNSQTVRYSWSFRVGP
jgi:hypothetical protein